MNDGSKSSEQKKSSKKKKEERKEKQIEINYDEDTKMVDEEDNHQFTE